MSEYVPHMNSLQPTMWSKALEYIHFTLLAYAAEHKCLPHHTCMSNYTSDIVYMKTAHCWIHKSNNTMNCTFICHVMTIYIPVVNMPPNATYANYFICKYETTVSLSTWYKLNAMKNVSKTTGIHKFHTTGICPWTICLPHCTFVPHYPSTVVGI